MLFRGGDVLYLGILGRAHATSVMQYRYYLLHYTLYYYYYYYYTWYNIAMVRCQ